MENFGAYRFWKGFEKKLAILIVGQIAIFFLGEINFRVQILYFYPHRPQRVMLKAQKATKARERESERAREGESERERE